MTTQQDIIRIEQQEIQRAIADGWTVEPWKGHKPEPEPGEGRPIIMVVFDYYGEKNRNDMIVEFNSMCNNMNEVREFYFHYTTKHFHFTGAWVYD